MPRLTKIEYEFVRDALGCIGITDTKGVSISRFVEAKPKVRRALDRAIDAFGGDSFPRWDKVYTRLVCAVADAIPENVKTAP